VKTSEEVQLEI